MSKEDSRDEEDFASLMAGVKRLPQERINQYQHRPVKPALRQRQYDNQIKDFSELSYQQAVDIRESWFDHGIQRKLQRKKKLPQKKLPKRQLLLRRRKL